MACDGDKPKRFSLNFAKRVIDPNDRIMVATIDYFRRFQMRNRRLAFVWINHNNERMIRR